MKRIIFIFFFLIFVQTSFATDWAWYYIYIQSDYPQGPWTRTDILDKSGNYVYLHPKQFEELFGSENGELANAILFHLEKETPKRYKFKNTLSLSGDTVVVETKDKIVDFEAVKNELTASFVLNSFIAVKLIEQGKTSVFQLKDISVPYMDLVSPMSSKSIVKEKRDTVVKDSVIFNEEVVYDADGKPENKTSIWLIISLVFNIFLILLLVKIKRKQ